MQSRLLRLADGADRSLRAHYAIESDVRPSSTRYTADARGVFAVLTTETQAVALEFCKAAAFAFGGSIPEVLQVAEIEHDEACARWL